MLPSSGGRLLRSSWGPVSLNSANAEGGRHRDLKLRGIQQSFGYMHIPDVPYIGAIVCDNYYW
jgi:hypothetical protein